MVESGEGGPASGRAARAARGGGRRLNHPAVPMGGFIPKSAKLSSVVLGIAKIGPVFGEGREGVMDEESPMKCMAFSCPQARKPFGYPQGQKNSALQAIIYENPTAHKTVYPRCAT